MTPRMHDNLLKGIFFIVIFMVLLLQAFFTKAQAPEKQSDMAFNPQFDTRQITQTGDIDEVNKAEPSPATRWSGLVFGQDMVKWNTGAGYEDRYGSNLRANCKYETFNQTSIKQNTHINFVWDQ